MDGVNLSSGVGTGLSLQASYNGVPVSLRPMLDPGNLIKRIARDRPAICAGPRHDPAAARSPGCQDRRLLLAAPGDVCRPGHQLGAAQARVAGDEVPVHVVLWPPIAGYKLPKDVRFVDALPMAATGKILKRAVREQMAAPR